MKTETMTYNLLNSISSPEDLRRLDVEQLPEVCKELRQDIIEEVSCNPGHFAASLGTVELTVALHYVFNTPHDRIVWDVGHQAYGHKILTGRRAAFSTNRRFKGIRPFPSPEESEYDTFACGHASNSISAALGMAVAAAAKGEEDRHVVAVIGDGSMSGGLAFEGLNNASSTPNNLLIILNDNDMSIDPNVGSLHRYLAHITTSKGYNDIRYTIYRVLRKLKLVSDKGKGKIMRFNNSLKALLSDEQNIFEGLNIRYFGPVDGHDIAGLVKVLGDIKDMHGPRLLHIKTQKGKGFTPAELDPATWHAPGRFNPETGEILSGNKNSQRPSVPKYQDVFGNTLLELARDDSKIVGITAAMPSGTSMSILKEEMPQRVFDVGISEEHAVTFAGGLAKDGLKPFVAIYSSFLQRAYDQIVHDVALTRLPVTFCVDRAGLVGEDGATHHGALDLIYLTSVPGMTVAAPRDEITLRNLMYTAATTEHGPFAIRYPRGGGHNPDWRRPMTAVEIGKGEVLAEGTDVVLLSTGTIAYETEQARMEVEKAGASAAHYHFTFVKPLDTDLLEKAAALHVPVITVEDGSVAGGFGALVASWFAEHHPQVQVTRLGIPDKFIPQGTVAQLKAICGIDAKGILGSINAVLGNHAAVQSNCSVLCE